MNIRLPMSRKAIFCCLFVLGSACSLLAQGFVQWGNAFGLTTSTFPAVRAPVFGPDPSDLFNPKVGNSATGFPVGTQIYGGALLAGTGFSIALYGMVGADFVQLDSTTFRTGTTAGFFHARVAQVPNHPGGSTATAILRAWDNQGGTITSWEQALATPSIPVGESAPFTVGPLGGDNPSGGPDLIPPQTMGVRSFSLSLRGAFITAQPQDRIVAAGTNAEFQVQVTSAIGTPLFQWQRDGANIPGATSATLALKNVQYTDAGGYGAIIIAPPLTLTSQVARLSVQPAIVSVSRFFIEEWGSDAIRVSFDSSPLRPVRIEVRSSLQDTWINMGQFFNPNVRGFFFDIGLTNDMRFYRLSMDP